MTTTIFGVIVGPFFKKEVVSFRSDVMAKIYHVGDLTRKDKKIRVYYNLSKDSFFCMDQKGNEIQLSSKMKSHIARKYNLNRSVHKYLHQLKSIMFAYSFLCFGFIALYYRRILPDIPEIVDISLSDDPDRLREKTIEYINQNENFTFEQREYLSETFSLYLQDYGDCYDFQASLYMLNNLAGVDVKYKELHEDGILGTYSDKSNLITMYTNDEQCFTHEGIHCSNPTLDPGALCEGYADAVSSSYGFAAINEFQPGYLSYKRVYYCDANEYLLLISEIIGKEKTMYYLINGKEKELVQTIAYVTSTDISDIESLFSSMNKQIVATQNFKDKTANSLASQIRQELARLAILANKENENNFIIQNAINHDYILSSSFLLDEYSYLDTYEANYLIINDSNKFDTCYVRTKSLSED